MSVNSSMPDQMIASHVAAAMLNERIISSEVMRNAILHSLYAIKTVTGDFILRITSKEHLNHFKGAVYWQSQLIPLGVPLAQFISTDLDGKFSPYPALLMWRLPGDDLINVYARLSNVEKRNLAKELVGIQTAVKTLPEGSCFGFALNYTHFEHIPTFASWYDFILDRFQLCVDLIRKAGVFNINEIEKVREVATRLEGNLRAVRPHPFMWDTSERNIMVYQGKISGIVDVDDMCFGDSLFVLALTYAALEYEGHDTVYPDAWAQLLHLDNNAKQRLGFYRLIYVVWFMRQGHWASTSNKTTALNVEKLNTLFQQALDRIGVDH